MDKKPKAVYAPGELDRVRGNLGSIDMEEAKKIAQKLGGEIGVERSASPAAEAGRGKSPVARSGGGHPNRPGMGASRRSEPSDGGAAAKAQKQDPGDDPTKPLRLSYMERVKMDRHAATLDFEIKNGLQVLVSMFSLFSQPPDYVNPRFVTKNMKAHYAKLEKLVVAARTLLPKNNARRTTRLKKVSPFAFRVLDTICNWNIEGIAKEMSRLQANPKKVKAADFSNILKLFYRPLFVMQYLDINDHVKEAMKVLYKLLQIESPMIAKEQYEPAIRTALLSFAEIRKDVQFCLYPLLMRLISDRFIPYDVFFIERRQRYTAFIGLADRDHIAPEDLSELPEIVEDGEAAEGAEGAGEADGALGEDGAEAAADAQGEEDPNDPEVAERKAAREAEKAERKAVDHGLATLEILFPKAGWAKLDEFPDLYPYFAEVYGLRRGFELIAPSDAMQQISVLMHILEDIFYGMRYIKFNSVMDIEEGVRGAEREISVIINHWRRYIDDTFYEDYLPRLSEYCRSIEHSSGSRSSPFIRKMNSELHWVKKLCFLPHYKFEAIGSPPFKKQDITTVYHEVRLLRKYLTSVAAGIEHGMRNGGAEAKAVCQGIGNPWEKCVFEIPNPVSKRLAALLPPEKRNNANLIFFALATVTVLDHIINYENSWSYQNDRPGPLFRSINNEGTIPQFGVDEKLNADQIFKEVMKNKMTTDDIHT